MIQNILVAIDGSDNSNRALDFALELAEKFSAAVTILNVSEPPAMGAVPSDPMSNSGGNMFTFSKDLLKFHEEILSKAVAKAKAAKPNLAVVSLLREGHPASEIVAAANEGGFDLVVVGHRGLGRVKEFFGMGGVSEKVAHLVLCPIVIVR